MIKELSKIKSINKLKNSKNLSCVKKVPQMNKFNPTHQNKVSNNIYNKINNKIKINKNRNRDIKNNEYTNNPLYKIIIDKKTIGKRNNIKLIKNKDIDTINTTYNYNFHKNKNPGNNKSDNLFLSIINNSSSNFFNSTNETSLNINNYKKSKKINCSQIRLSTEDINNKIKNNNYKRNNTNTNIKKSNNINKFIIKDKIKVIDKMKKIYLYNNLKKDKNKDKKKPINNNNETPNIPNLIISIKKIKNNFIIPLRNEYNLKKANSLDIKNKIIKLKNEILENNKEIDIIEKNKSFINLDYKKNLTIIFMQKLKSLIYNNDNNKLREYINNIKNEIKKVNEETKLYKRKYDIIFDEIKNNEKEIKNIKKEINDFSGIKNNVRTMIILLNKRIIDAKERIRKMDIKKQNLNKSWFELSLKYSINDK